MRDALRKADEAGLMAGIRQMFDEHPAEIETYLEAVLAADVGEANLSPEAKKLAGTVGPLLDAFRQKAELAKLFDTLAMDQRQHAKDLKTKLEKDFQDAAKAVGVSMLKVPASLVVVPNPLDAHGSVRWVRAKDRTYLVTGPGFKTAERALLQLAMETSVRPAVEAAWSSTGGQKYAKHWDAALKGTSRITQRWPDGKAYLADTLARLLTYKIVTKGDPKATKEAEDEYLEDLSRENLKWSRVAMRALDGFDGSEPLEGALGKLLAKSFP